MKAPALAGPVKPKPDLTQCFYRTCTAKPTIVLKPAYSDPTAWCPEHVDGVEKAMWLGHGGGEGYSVTRTPVSEWRS